MEGMMMSERPGGGGAGGGGGAASGAAAGGGGGAAGGSVGIGNYKGVMLCNRPFAGVAVSTRTAQSGEKPTFLCGTVSKDLGANVPISSKEAQIDRPKKETALTRHRRWLADLQRTKERLEQEYLEEIQKKEESRQKFMEREARMRQIARTTVTNPHQSTHSAEGGEDERVQSPALSSAQKKKRAQGKKPMWAMTEEKAEEEVKRKEDEEEEELLDFAQNLDFEKYIDDMEVQTMIDRVKQRVAELEQLERSDARAEDLAERRAEAERDHKARQEVDLKDYESALGAGIDGEEEEDEEEAKDREEEEARSVARSVLSDAHAAGVGAVHSTQSLTAMASRARDRITTGGSDQVAGLENNGIPEGKEGVGDAAPTQEPRVVVHAEDRVEKLGEKQASNLPYMHRNPAV